MCINCDKGKINKILLKILRGKQVVSTIYFPIPTSDYLPSIYFHNICYVKHFLMHTIWKMVGEIQLFLISKSILAARNRWQYTHFPISLSISHPITVAFPLLLREKQEIWKKSVEIWIVILLCFRESIHHLAFKNS